MGNRLSHESTRRSSRCSAFALALLTFALSACSGRAFSLDEQPIAAGSGGMPPAEGAPIGGNPELPLSRRVLPVGGEGGAPAGGAGGSAAPGGTGGSDGGRATGEAGGAPANPTLVYAAVDDTPLRGNIGVDTLTTRDFCAAGSVLIGVQGQLSNDVVGQLQGVCGTLELTGDGANQLLLQPGDVLPLRGDAAESPLQALCPAQQVVVGFEGQSGLLLDQIRLRCAPLTIEDGIVEVGTPQALAPVGGSGGSAFPTTDCPAESVAAGTLIAVDHWLSGLGLACIRVRRVD
jgi:hypothetical protein